VRRPSLWLLTLALLCPCATPGQEQPRAFAGLSHRDRLYDVTSRGAVVMAVGYPGVVLRSTDGGASFSPIDVPTREALFGVDVDAHGLVVVVGRAGTVLVSSDDGASWWLGNAFGSTAGPEPAVAAAGGLGAAPVPAISDLFDVDVLDGGHVVATGEYGAIVVSEDAGKTWQRRPYTAELPGASGPTPSALEGAQAEGLAGATSLHNRKSGVESGDPAAQIWLDQSDASAEEANADATDEAVLSSVAFADDRRGWIVGEFGLVLATEDGGTHWRRVYSPVGVQLFGIAVAGAGHLVAVGRDGIVIESTDGGSTWQLEPTPTREHLFAVWASGARVVAVGARGTVLVRDRAGAPLQLLEPPAHTALTAAWFDGQRGFVVGTRGHLLETRDGSRFELISGQ
jgi:photosystem II stability/assembly factor-like uncharacterized protein